jgi:hypothetical protein
MLLVVLLVFEMRHATQQIQGSFSELMVYEEHADDSAGTIASGVALNSLVIVGMLFGVTTCLLALYKFRCYVIIYAWLFFSVCSLLGAFGGCAQSGVHRAQRRGADLQTRVARAHRYVLQQLLIIHDVPCDAVSFTFALYNLAAGGSLVVFWTEFGLGPTPPLQTQQVYLVVMSALLAWSATKVCRAPALHT